MTFFIIFVVKIFICFGIFGRMFHHFGWFDLGEKSINVTWLSLNALSAPSLPPLVQIFGGVSSSSTAIITKNAFFPLQPTKIKKQRQNEKIRNIRDTWTDRGKSLKSPWRPRENATRLDVVKNVQNSPGITRLKPGGPSWGWRKGWKIFIGQKKAKCWKKTNFSVIFQGMFWHSYGIFPKNCVISIKCVIFESKLSNFMSYFQSKNWIFCKTSVWNWPIFTARKWWRLTFSLN